MSWLTAMTGAKLCGMKGLRATLLLLGGLTLAVADDGARHASAAQRPFQPGGIGLFPSAPRYDTTDALTSYDSGTHFCRLWLQHGYAGDGQRWYVDFPRPDDNLTIRLSDHTTATVTT